MKKHEAYYLGNPKSMEEFISQARVKGFGVEEISMGKCAIQMNPTSAICPGEIVDKRYLIIFAETDKDGRYDEAVSKLQKLAEEFKSYN